MERSSLEESTFSRIEGMFSLDTPANQVLLQGSGREPEGPGTLSQYSITMEDKWVVAGPTNNYLTREYYDRDKVAGFRKFRHIFPGRIIPKIK